MSPDIYNNRMNTINIVVSAITALIPTLDWIFAGRNKVYDVLAYAEIFPLVISCIILFWALKKLIRLLDSPTDHIVNRQMILWHIIAYFLIVAADIAVNFFYNEWKSYAIATYCLLVINLVCNLILVHIVNTICTKCMLIKSSTDEERFSEDDLRTGSLMPEDLEFNESNGPKQSNR